MRTRRVALLALSICLGAASCAAKTPEPPAPAVAERAATALAPFKADLMQALQAGLAESPLAAVRVCRIDAPTIAARAGSGDLRVGRSSHRLRNPDNAPDPWMQSVIDAYRANREDRQPRTVSLGGDRYGYAEPIVMQPMCTTCHGKVLAPDLQAAIAALYPADQATGFAVGDLRGIFWVTLDGTPATAGGSR